MNPMRYRWSRRLLLLALSWLLIWIANQFYAPLPFSAQLHQQGNSAYRQVRTWFAVSQHAFASAGQRLNAVPLPMRQQTPAVTVLNPRVLLPTVTPPALALNPTVVLTSTLTPAVVFATATAAQEATIAARLLMTGTATPTPTPTPLSIFLPPGAPPDATATALQVEAESTVAAVLTSVNRPEMVIERSTPTPTPIVVTATPTPNDLFLAATLAAQVTQAATLTGTWTPLPDNWLVVTPVYVYATPTPANAATAVYVAAQATALAATTGTPDPYRVTAIITVVTATATPTSLVAAAKTLVAATQQALVNGTATLLPPHWRVVTPVVVTNTPTPANAATAEMQFNMGQAIAVLTGTPPPYAVIAVATPTPVLIPVEDPALLGDDLILSPPKVLFPAELVGKILFIGEFNRDQGNLRQVYYAINPDGAGLARLTDGWAYAITEERDSYSADGSARVFAQRDPNDQRIQIHLEDFAYNTSKALTAFGAGVAWQPAWSPTSNQIALVSNESRNDEIWVVERGAWPALQYTKNDWAWDHHPSWSADGNTLVFSSNRTGEQQLWLMDADGNNQRQLTSFAFAARDPVWVKYADPYLPLAEPADDGDPETKERVCLVCLYVTNR